MGPDRDHGLACDTCKVLVDEFSDKYGSCTGYCASLDRWCVGAWDEHHDTCQQKEEMIATSLWTPAMRSVSAGLARLQVQAAQRVHGQTWTMARCVPIARLSSTISSGIGPARTIATTLDVDVWVPG